jgi:hypothetical protein
MIPTQPTTCGSREDVREQDERAESDHVKKVLGTQAMLRWSERVKVEKREKNSLPCMMACVNFYVRGSSDDSSCFSAQS